MYSGGFEILFCLFSSTKVATGHGNDHLIKISDCYTLRVLYNLSGHRRTPWCVAFHPKLSSILASGCLGGEVRLWHLDVSISCCSINA